MSRCGLPRSPQSCRGHDVPAHFGWNATYEAERVGVEGEYRSYTRDSEDGFWVSNHFCARCGVTIFYEIERRPLMVSIPAGAFADAGFPQPAIEVHEGRACFWLPPLGLPREP
jgi:hypothetical protein